MVICSLSCFLNFTMPQTYAPINAKRGVIMFIFSSFYHLQLNFILTSAGIPTIDTANFNVGHAIRSPL